MPDITNVLLDEWAKIPTETLQNLVESLPSCKEGDQLHINAYGFRTGCHKKAPVGVTRWWSNTFVHAVYKEFLCGNVLSKLPATFFQCMNSSTCEHF